MVHGQNLHQTKCEKIQILAEDFSSEPNVSELSNLPNELGPELTLGPRSLIMIDFGLGPSPLDSSCIVYNIYVYNVCVRWKNIRDKCADEKVLSWFMWVYWIYYLTQAGINWTQTLKWLDLFGIVILERFFYYLEQKTAGSLETFLFVWCGLLKKKMLLRNMFQKIIFQEIIKVIFEVILFFFIWTQKNSERLLYPDVINFWMLHKLLKIKNDKQHSSGFVLNNYFSQNKKIEQENLHISNVVFFFRKKIVSVYAY